MPIGTSEASRLRLVVLAAQPVVRVGVRHLLEGEKTLVLAGEAANTADAASLVSAQRPDVILLDPDSEDFSLDSVTTLLGLSEAKILVFTAATELTLNHHAVALGAMGVVLKRHSGRTMARALERVHAGEIWFEPGAAARMVRGMLARNADPEALKIGSLTRRELEVVGLIGGGLKTNAIADRLFISKATVRNHLTSIFDKLGLSDRFELAFYAARHGLVRRDADTQGGVRMHAHVLPPLGPVSALKM